MKKSILLIALVLMLLLAACGQAGVDAESEMVSIYIPVSIATLSPDGTAQIMMNYVFEEGWQEKESFSVSFRFVDPQGILGEADAMIDQIKMTYAEAYAMQETAGTYRTETVYDENGRAISQTMTYFIETAPNEKTETAMTYDELGRLLTQETKNYVRGKAEPEVTTETFVYTETDTGSEGVATSGAITSVRVYDKNGHVICQYTLRNGEETKRTESEYDDAGNLLKSASYFQGQKMTEYLYTYTAVEVSAECAARIPQFKRVK